MLTYQAGPLCFIKQISLDTTKTQTHAYIHQLIKHSEPSM